MEDKQLINLMLEALKSAKVELLTAKTLIDNPLFIGELRLTLDKIELSIKTAQQNGYNN